MRTEAALIEQNYLKTIQNTEKEHIDFFGIDLTSAAPDDLTYKLYCSSHTSKNSHHPLVETVRQRGMLRHFEDVADSVRPDAVRLDISLRARNDDNMEALLAYLEAQTPFFPPHSAAVRRIAEMKITEEPGYRYASLYHVGLVEHQGTAELLKFHFFTRWCPDPNRHSKDGYRDAAFLDDLRQTGIPEYGILAQQTAAALEACGGHLWMAGMDIARDKVKYKLYIKDPLHIYERLPAIAGEYAAGPLRRIAAWNEAYPQCRPAGAAFALDSRGCASLNLYYHVD